VSATWSGSTAWTWWTLCLDKPWTGPTSVISVCSAHSQLKVHRFLNLQDWYSRFLMLHFSV
jgi:hypothetical protein